MRGLDEELQGLLRSLEQSPGDWAGWLRLGQLHLRAGNPLGAREALERARGAMPPLLATAEGGVDLRAEWTELQEQLATLGEETERLLRAGQRETLLAALAAGTISRAEHATLIALEVRDELPVHPETPGCPACAGPVTSGEQGLRCARSGREGDVCRHTDAKGLHACARCGLILRAWDPRTQGRLPTDDPFEPPLGVPHKSRCPRCQGAVADWKRHFLRCPRARPADFPVCRVCGRRGFHARVISCPRCAAEVVSAPCLE